MFSWNNSITATSFKENIYFALPCICSISHDYGQLGAITWEAKCTWAQKVKYYTPGMPRTARERSDLWIYKYDARFVQRAFILSILFHHLPSVLLSDRGADSFQTLYPLVSHSKLGIVIKFPSAPLSLYLSSAVVAALLKPICLHSWPEAIVPLCSSNTHTHTRDDHSKNGKNAVWCSRTANVNNELRVPATPCLARRFADPFPKAQWGNKK